MAPDKPESAVPEEPKISSEHLHQLNEELYAREQSPTLRSREAELKEIGIRRQVFAPNQLDHVQRPVAFASLRERFASRRHRMFLALLLASVIGVILALSIFAVVWYRDRQTVTEDQIAITMTAPGEFTAGEEITYQLTYANRSHVSWQNVELVLEVPRGFTKRQSSRETEGSGKEFVVSIGELPPGREETFTLSGTLIGEQNAVLSTRAALAITPANFPSGRFSKQTVITTTITSSPVELSLDAPTTAESGEHIIAGIQIRNTSPRPLTGAYLKIKTATELQVATTDPEFSPDFSITESAWELGTLNPLEAVRRTAVLIPEGRPGERRTIEMEVGIRQGEELFVQRTFTHIVTVTASELTIDQTYNNSTEPLVLKPGEVAEGKIRYANVGSKGLKDVVINITFTGAGLDPASLKVAGGGYDPRARTLTWTAATVPELALLQPQQSGEINYSFAILPTTGFPTEGTGDALKNFTLNVEAHIDSPDLFTPSGKPRKVISDQMTFSIQTPLLLGAEAFYDDGRLGLASSGPLPPKVGEETTYTLRFRVGSLLNDLGAVTTTSVLPDGVRYTGKTYKTIGDIEFSERTGEIKWVIASLPGGSGRLQPPAELHVQVAVVPSEHQVGKTIALLNRMQVSGQDVFTDKLVEERAIDLPTTDTAAPRRGTVED